MKRRAQRRRSAPAAAAGRARRRGRALELSYAIAIMAAVVLAVMVNILSARHYRRWDWTSGSLYTLSTTTTHTLTSLAEPVHIYVLLSEADPLTVTLRHLLTAYTANTRQLVVDFVDPDRRPAEFIAIQRRYGIAVGKTEGGRVVTDAAIVVVRGKRHHFVTSDELVEIDDPEDLRARPRLEQALTGAIRHVVAGEAPRVCFSSGHGEDSIMQVGPGGIASLADRLQKDNYQTLELDPSDPPQGSADPPQGSASLESCRLVVIAGPKRRFEPDDVARLRAYLDQGGNLLLALGPMPDAVAEAYLDVGLAPLVKAAHVTLHDDFIFELDPMQRSSHGFGEAFAAEPQPHDITQGLLAAEEHGFEVVLEVARSLEASPHGAVVPTPLLVTSEDAFGMVDFFAWARDPGTPEAGDADREGPLVVGYATELPNLEGQAAHGPRVVVLGSSSVLHSANWQREELRGTALFVESAISWLASEPIVLDIPAKPSRAVGLRMSEDALSSVLWTSLLYVPFGAALLGVAVSLRRRASEGRSRRRAAAAHNDDSARGPKGGDEGDKGGDEGDEGGDEGERS